MEVGSSVLFKALLTDGRTGSHRDVTQTAQWTSTNRKALSIVNGWAQTSEAGQATLHARIDNLIGTLVVTIHSPEPGAGATLVLESISVYVSGPSPSGYYGYLVRFRVRETGGQSSATIGDILVSGPDGSALTGPSCWGDQLVVPAGGRLDTFDTDEGLRWLLYCAPGVAGRTANPTLRIKVNYVDHRGRPGVAEGEVGGTP